MKSGSSDFGLYVLGRQERPIHGSAEGVVRKSSIARLPIGSRPPTPDVQSLWSFD